MSSASQYDFIVVGAGPAGACVASRLAKTATKPAVLLLEAGGDNSGPETRIAGERHTFWMGAGGLKIDYGYQTVSQPALNGRRLAYHRGKGLGGSSATNLGLWDWGARREYEQWARLVGDDTWSWGRVVEHMKKIENYHNLTPEEYGKCVAPDSAGHGTGGPVDVTLGGVWDPTLPLILEAVREYGELPLVPDVSSHDSIGFGVSPATTRGPYRVTASSAYLDNPPENLDIVTDTPVTRLLFQGTRAVGVEVSSGKTYYGTKEIILSAGAIDTPKILLLSGVGPADELAALDIRVVLDQPCIGRHLLDHPILRLAAPVQQGFISADGKAPSPQSSREQWLKDRTGLLADDPVLSAHGYCRLDTTEYEGLQTLSDSVRAHLTHSDTRAYEILSRITPHPQQPGTFLWNISVVMMNSQSTGRVYLTSADPQDPVAIDLNFLSNKYDIEATVEAVQKTARFLRNATIPTEDISVGPRSLERADVLEFVRSSLGHLWHAGGTVKMGRKGEQETCVTPDFRVAGLEGLRVADLSVMPIMPSNHTQSTAYLVGEIAAQKLIAEYGLDGLAN